LGASLVESVRKRFPEMREESLKMNERRGAWSLGMLKIIHLYLILSLHAFSLLIAHCREMLT
jgi:hypothetical protein